jgi:hypothetical protein
MTNCSLSFFLHLQSNRRRWQCHCHILRSKKMKKKKNESSWFLQEEEEIEKDNRWHHRYLLRNKIKCRKQKRRRRRELTFELALLSPPWSSSCFRTPTAHHIEAPLVGALLKLPALVDFTLLKFWASQAFPRSEALVMKVSAKGVGWGGGQ